MTTRIYTIKHGATMKLIRAKSRQQALTHHLKAVVADARANTETTLATNEDTYVAGQKGITVEVAGDIPDDTAGA